MTKVKKFFRIESNYKFEWTDLCAFITIANVVFVLCGFWWAPIIGLCGCGLNLVLNVIGRAHINLYLIQIALIILNSYFLTL